MFTTSQALYVLQIALPVETSLACKSVAVVVDGGGPATCLVSEGEFAMLIIQDERGDKIWLCVCALADHPICD